jgi:hypothetical protein
MSEASYRDRVQGVDGIEMRGNGATSATSAFRRRTSNMTARLMTSLELIPSFAAAHSMAARRSALQRKVIGAVSVSAVLNFIAMILFGWAHDRERPPGRHRSVLWVGEMRSGSKKAAEAARIS